MEKCNHPKNRIWQYNGWWKCLVCYFEFNGTYKYSKFNKKSKENEKQ